MKLTEKFKYILFQDWDKRDETNGQVLEQLIQAVKERDKGIKEIDIPIRFKRSPEYQEGVRAALDSSIESLTKYLEETI